MATVRFTILGCGSSGGVPRLGGKWGKCDPAEARNRRLRCSLLVQLLDHGGATQVLVDTSPDMRAQLLAAGVGHLDGVVYTHAHADHVNGLDDLRMIYGNRGRKRIPVWADSPTRSSLLQRFSYAFETPEGSDYPPILRMMEMNGPVSVRGAGGALELAPFVVSHGRITANGFRIFDIAYLPDVSEMNPDAWNAVSGLECWIVDALRVKPHPSHTHLEQTLRWIDIAAPRRAVLTNMHNDLDYAEVSAGTPPHVEPAYDGLTIEYEI